MVDAVKRVVDAVKGRPRKVSKKHVPAELSEYAKKRLKKRTTSRDVPGKGMAKKAAYAIEKRKRRLRDIDRY